MSEITESVKQNPYYLIKVYRGKVTHDLPAEMSIHDFTFIWGSVTSHLIDELGRRKNFTIRIDLDENLKPSGSYIV